MAGKTARAYTVEELKEKAQRALADPKLVEIVKTAPLNKDGKVNLTWVYREAEKYVHGETKDLQKTKELAVATRFLAMLRRDYEEEFDKLVSPPQNQRKEFSDEELLLPEFTKISLRFDRVSAIEFCLKVLPKSLDGLNLKLTPEWDLMRDVKNCLIQLLEKNSGLR